MKMRQRLREIERKKKIRKEDADAKSAVRTKVVPVIVIVF
jgi:hypothetical protein